MALRCRPPLRAGRGDNIQRRDSQQKDKLYLDEMLQKRL
jgi:hypothetical protein